MKSMNCKICKVVNGQVPLLWLAYNLLAFQTSIKVAFLEAGFYSANQSDLKSFDWLEISWPSKKDNWILGMYHKQAIIVPSQFIKK